MKIPSLGLFSRTISMGYQHLSGPESEKSSDKSPTRGCLACFNFGTPCTPAMRKRELVAQAMDRGLKDRENQLKIWMKLRQLCLEHGFSLRDTVERELSNGATPLQTLIASIEHESLHFLQSNLPGGLYKGDIYLSGTRLPLKEKTFETFPLKRTKRAGPVTYEGQICTSDVRPEGFGVLHWSDGIKYVGHWTSTNIFGHSPQHPHYYRAAFFDSKEPRIFLFTLTGMAINCVYKRA